MEKKHQQFGRAEGRTEQCDQRGWGPSSLPHHYTADTGRHSEIYLSKEIEMKEKNLSTKLIYFFYNV